MAKQPAWLVVALVVGMLFTGTLNTLCTKILFTLHSEGVNGTDKIFAKPWCGTWNMLFAMLVVGLIDKGYSSICVRKPAMSMDDNALLPDKIPEVSHTHKVLLVAFPALFDLLATALACIGILYIPASVWQMLRGACIIFSAFFAVVWLRRRLMAFNIVGLTLCVVGVCTVGIASVSGGGADVGTDRGTSSLAFGIAMVLLAQVVQAAQVVAEEWLMKDVDLPMFQIVGWEGFWGCLMMLIVVFPLLQLLPGQDEGSMENTVDTLAMISNNHGVFLCCLTYIFSCATFNATGIAVTGALSAVHRMMLDASRTTVIWAFGLYVHYHYDPNSLFGEVWTPYSKYQLFGFVILVCGQAIYGEVLKLPGFNYPNAVLKGMESPASALNFMSPLPRGAEEG